MKIQQCLLAVAMGCLLASCFKEEPLNAECDILEAAIPVSQLEGMFFNDVERQVKVLSADSIITFKVRRDAQLTAVAPTFRITEGATMQPANGSTHDFSHGAVTYTITSEDGQWSRKYKVSLMPTTRTVRDTTHYDFEHYKQHPGGGQFYVWYEIDENGNETDEWATGNHAFAMGAGNLPGDQYPSAPVAKGGHHGAYAKLTTCSTGDLGKMFGKPMAAGNLFLGKFDASIALMDPMGATQFGVPIDKKPIKFAGWYKYNPGEKFLDNKMNIIEGRTDCGAIYAVVYRNTKVGADGKPTKVVLNGSNILTSNDIVGMAQLGDIKAAAEWTPFEIIFSYTEDIDERMLQDRGYSLAVVFSSSRNGAKFEGAIGSELCIDDVKIICTREE